MDQEQEFKDLANTYGREDIGVVFCGAPMIAAALKEGCEKYSKKEGTIFRLHKENFCIALMLRLEPTTSPCHSAHLSHDSH